MSSSDYKVCCPVCLRRAVEPFSEQETGECENCGTRLQFCTECHGYGVENPDYDPPWWIDCGYCQGTGLEIYSERE